jgi:hypothetical protein
VNSPDVVVEFLKESLVEKQSVRVSVSLNLFLHMFFFKTGFKGKRGWVRFRE